MRTTIRLDDSLLRSAKSQAASSGRSLNDFIADAVRAAVSRRGVRAVARDLPTFDGRGLQRSVDLDDSAALLELMETPGETSTPNIAVDRAQPPARVAKVAEPPVKRRK
jgi:hypothetical protein